MTTIFKKDFKMPKYGNDTINLVESMKGYISKHDCPNLFMDISHLNILDASKVTILCSNYHWEKYPEGQISWKISSDEVKDIINPMTLGNVCLINAQ